MPVTSSRNVQIGFSGDIESQIIQSALDNGVSLATIEILTLPIGNNTVAPPVVAGLLATALTILPPSGNVNLIKLKSVAGDAGIPIHPTDPTVIGLDTTFVSLVLTVTVETVGVRLIWS